MSQQFRRIATPDKKRFQPPAGRVNPARLKTILANLAKFRLTGQMGGRTPTSATTNQRKEKH